jgi:hypothetical protein
MILELRDCLLVLVVVKNEFVSPEVGDRIALLVRDIDLDELSRDSHFMLKRDLSFGLEEVGLLARA